MENIFDYWFIFVIGAILLLALFMYIRQLLDEPKEKQIENVKEWLKFAVIEAERELGSKTGQLKLRLVYDMAITNFDWIPNIVTFNTFSTWVDEALNWAKVQLAQNDAVQRYVEGE